ncbi:MAG: RNase adapter RapZ [Proteobacteria bacterium]|nr:RNase adapter RapZ [Pseudomonadota bacterium]MBU1612086.1 RNase adapter RapZ [Pseudomonadota bacterium]
MKPISPFPVIVVTGLSGGGKSTALKVFEDLGYFCVDGLPVSMLPKLVTIFSGRDAQHRGLVLGMDLRQLDFTVEWEEAVAEMKTLGFTVQTVYLDCRLDTLVKRYATTRRPHPLESESRGLRQALEEEKQLLAPIRRNAELVVDTTEYSIHDLRRTLQEKWAVIGESSGSLRVHIVSFGFKHGVPIDCDLLFDMRFLPNPYFDEALRPLSGKDKPIAEFVLESEIGKEFKQRFLDFLCYLLPLYTEEGRYRVTIGIGCTGGRHRSVCVSELMSAMLKELNYTVTLEHRHVEMV